MKTMYIGGIAIPILAALDLDQQYVEMGGEHVFRSAKGRGIKQTTWQKTKITTSGIGWIPPGLENLDFTLPQVLKCVVPQSITLPEASHTATLPMSRRHDAGHQPYAIALLPGGRSQMTAVGVAGDVGTVTPVAGAIGYSIAWYPEFNVWVQRPTRSGSRGEASHRWELICEEV